jgi:hypothetical protein
LWRAAKTAVPSAIGELVSVIAMEIYSSGNYAFQQTEMQGNFTVR